MLINIQVTEGRLQHLSVKVEELISGTSLTAYSLSVNEDHKEGAYIPVKVTCILNILATANLCGEAQTQLATIKPILLCSLTVILKRC